MPPTIGCSLSRQLPFLYLSRHCPIVQSPSHGPAPLPLSQNPLCSCDRCPSTHIMSCLTITSRFVYISLSLAIQSVCYVLNLWHHALVSHRSLSLSLSFSLCLSLYNGQPVPLHFIQFRTIVFSLGISAHCFGVWWKSQSPFFFMY